MLHAMHAFPLSPWRPPALPPSSLPACPAPVVQDFATLQLDELEKNIASRRNKIFLLMEEVGCTILLQHCQSGGWGGSVRVPCKQ